MKKTKLLGVALSLASSITMAQVAGVEWANNPQFENTNGPYMMGYEFVVDSTQTVVALGAFDDLGNGFATGQHRVGLWKFDTETLLAEAVVSNDDALQGHFRYASITGVELVAGVRYVVGADNWGAGGDAWAWRETGGLSLIQAPGLRHIQDKFDAGSDFFMPFYSEGNFRDGFYGGNLMLAPAAMIAPIPEPSTYALMGLGLGLVGLLQRRRQKA
jgi:PEP-CTERM motif